MNQEEEETFLEPVWSWYLKKLNEVEGNEKYRVEISNRFAALEGLDAKVDINTIWETIRIYQFQRKRVWVIMKWSSISHGLMKDAQNYYTRGSKLNCSGYRIQVK
jgi:hypothetical protein